MPKEVPISMRRERISTRGISKREGHLIERMDGHYGGIADLGTCQAAVKRLHSLGIVHGDLNRYNFIVSPSGATLIDFENARKNGSKEVMQKEFTQLAEQLTEESGRGGGSIRKSDNDTS
jgi:tRNA A-37 threonylcarbamoyl transferase component Bud32